MSGHPLVTIGIPFYNEERYIAATINSALNQSFKDIQILISDNCSTDSSYSIAREYADKDARIKLYRQSENIGPIPNFEFLLANSSTKYFMWLGGHDMIDEQYIEQAVAALEQHTNCILAYPGGIIVDDKGAQTGIINDDYDTNGLRLDIALLKIAKTFNNGYVIHGVFRTETLKKLKFEKVNSPDMLMILNSNFYGRIVRIPMVGFMRRMVRKETPKQQSERHIQLGIYTKSSLNPFNQLYAIFLRYLFENGEISIPRKILLSIRLKRIFEKRFNADWSSIIKASFNRN